MIRVLVHWLRRGVAHAVAECLAGSPQGPTPEDDRGAGI
jgi:hypothetical protein